MAQNKVRTVPTFRAPSAYEEEMMRAQRQQQLAEMLRQQAFTPDEEPYTFQGFRATPSPTNALARVLSAYTSKKLGEKAEEAEGKARQADLEAFETLRRDLGPQTRTVAPDMFGDPMEMGSKYTPPVTETVMPTYQQREETLSRALAGATRLLCCRAKEQLTYCLMNLPRALRRKTLKPSKQVKPHWGKLKLQTMCVICFSKTQLPAQGRPHDLRLKKVWQVQALLRVIVQALQRICRQISPKQHFPLLRQAG